MSSKIQTGLRMPEERYEKIQEYADAVGVSLNSAILLLVDIGLRAVESVSLPQTEGGQFSSPSAGQHTP